MTWARLPWNTGLICLSRNIPASPIGFYGGPMKSYFETDREFSDDNYHTVHLQEMSMFSASSAFSPNETVMSITSGCEQAHCPMWHWLVKMHT